jgi:hypothetical protein
MTPEESREEFIDSVFHGKTLQALKELGLYEKYVKGEISINAIYNTLKDQGV